MNSNFHFIQFSLLPSSMVEDREKNVTWKFKAHYTNNFVFCRNHDGSGAVRGVFQGFKLKERLKAFELFLI